MKTVRISASLFLGCLLIGACEKNLDQEPIGVVDETQLANKKGVEGLLIGAYSLLDGVGLGGNDISGSEAQWGRSATNWIYGSICGSEAYTGSTEGDNPPIIQLEQFSGTPQNYNTEQKWSLVYAGIQRANEVIRVMKKATDISIGDQARIEAEARFLRGFYHFEAAKMWNKVPYVDESITYGTGNYFLPNDTLIWGAIENDFRFAMENLPSVMNAAGRANKYAAEAYLAKTLMFQGSRDPAKFAAARPLLLDLVTSGVTASGTRYQLLESFHDNFNPATKNNSESVFSAQASVNDGATGINGSLGEVLNFIWGTDPGNCCGFFQPSQYLVNHYKTDPVTGLPDLDHFNDEPVKNDDGLTATDPFTPYTGTLDPRLDWTVGRRGIPFLDWGVHPGDDGLWIRSQYWGGPYSPMKHIYAKAQQEQFTDKSFWSSAASAMNINLVRFADVLLWAAEAEAEAGSLDQALEYVNQVRARAADPAGWVRNQAGPFAPYAANYKIGLYPAGSFANKEYALKAIRYERMLELAMEGHRFFDLVRWGVADQEINAYLAKEKTYRVHLNTAQFKKGTHEYFPIPQSQIDLSAGPDGIPKIKQNPGY
jgi:hypothetical protein